MKLRDIFAQQYVLLETQYGVLDIDTSYDEDNYQLSHKGSATLSYLRELSPYIYQMIMDLGAEDAENKEIQVYGGEIIKASGTETCTVYAPDFWQ